MKGQANIEYIAAMIIFIIIVIYISFQASGNIPLYHANSMKNRLYGKCFSLSERLIKDSALGFAKEPYVLNSTKLKEFNQSCESDYENVLENFFKLESRRDFQLRVHVNNSFNFTCGRKYIPTHIVLAEIERYAVTDNQITAISLTLW